ncbi:MAG: PEP-CTERM sorting domain-containing protein [Cyanobacteria bacterium J06554_6]
MLNNAIKKFSLAATGGALVALTAGSAQAASFRPTTWTDEVSGIHEKLNRGDSYSYTHDITDNGFDGFPHDIVLGYELGVKLEDDSSSRFDLFELASIDLPGFIGDRVYEVNAGTYFGGVSLAAVVQLNLAGQLDVTIKSLAGDFKVVSSHLTAYGKEKVKDVPEPTSLLGLALLGTVGAGSALKRKQTTQDV